MEGVVVCLDINFKLFNKEIASQIGTDHTQKNLRLRYVLEGHTVPMEIRNDMGVKMYLSLMKNVFDMLKFSFCVDSYDAEVASCSVDVASFGDVTGVIDRVESIQMNCLNIINDSYNKVVRVKQTYMDKKILVSVLHNYALDRRFQFYAKRSCKSRNFLTCYICRDLSMVFPGFQINEIEDLQGSRISQ